MIEITFSKIAEELFKGERKWASLNGLEIRDVLTTLRGPNIIIAFPLKDGRTLEAFINADDDKQTFDTIYTFITPDGKSGVRFMGTSHEIPFITGDNKADAIRTLFLIKNEILLVKDEANLLLREMKTFIDQKSKTAMGTVRIQR